MRGLMDEISMAGGVVKRSLQDTYGYLGTVAILSLAWFVSVAGVALVLGLVVKPDLIGSIAMALALVVVAAPLAGAAFHVTSLIIAGSEATLADFATGLRRFWLRSVAVTVAHLGAMCVVAVDMTWFMARPAALPKVVGAFWLWVLVFLIMMTPYYFPIMVQQDAGFRRIAKRAALLALANPLYSLLIVVFIAVVTAACVVIPPAFSLLYLGVVAFAANRAARTLFEKYRVVDTQSTH